MLHCIFPYTFHVQAMHQAQPSLSGELHLLLAVPSAASRSLVCSVLLSATE